MMTDECQFPSLRTTQTVRSRSALAHIMSPAAPGGAVDALLSGNDAPRRAVAYLGAHNGLGAAAYHEDER